MRFQFSLAALFLATAAAGVMCGLLRVTPFEVASAIYFTLLILPLAVILTEITAASTALSFVLIDALMGRFGRKRVG